MADLKRHHAGGVMRVELPGGSWGALPTALLEDSRLALDSRAAGAWLATRPDGWQISVAHMQAKLGLGKDRWLRVAKELEIAGYLTRSCMPGADGKFVWTITFCPVPSTVVGFAVHGGAVDGSDRHKKEEVNKKKTPKERERAGTARRARMGGGLVLDEKTGIHHKPKDTRDQRALQAIARHHPQAVAAAVAAAADLDDQGRAFPAPVLRHLLRAKAPHARREEVPAWARMAASGAEPEATGGQIVEGEAKWTD